MPFDIRHHHVLTRQIAAYGNFSSFVMECFEKTPRSFFLPASLEHKAYVEDGIALSKERTVMAPLTLARLMRYLPVAADKNIMVVGGSTGYSAALLSYQVSSVFLLESDDQWEGSAQAGLSALHIDNVVLCQGNLKEGLARQGPFYFVIIDGAVEHIPPCFFDQLTEDSIGVFACQSEGLPTGHMTRFWRTKRGTVSQEPLFEMPCSLLKEFSLPPKFEF